MRSASHAHTTPEPTAAEASPLLPTGCTPQRRVMRAAWALHHDHGGNFADAMKKAWQHERARSALSAVKSLNSHLVDEAYIQGAVKELRAALPIEDYNLILRNSRDLLIDLIGRLVDVLDCIDGDSDEEPEALEIDDRDLPLMSAGYEKDTRMRFFCVD
ncbi:hypothetical protein [Methylobacterium trifolii]|uniref:hypothetical protein n=1 Tax=Methylobacterium trifolii TaxID=1003092 RepID=UPI001EDFBA74|nr:hypothetical protein [Methylobacterium trifolii]